MVAQRSNPKKKRSTSQKTRDQKRCTKARAMHEEQVLPGVCCGNRTTSLSSNAKILGLTFVSRGIPMGCLRDPNGIAEFISMDNNPAQSAGACPMGKRSNSRDSTFVDGPLQVRQPHMDYAPVNLSL